MPAVNQGDTLRILVEAMGRINYSRQIHDHKGITEKVELIKSEEEVILLKDWEISLIDARTYPVEWNNIVGKEPGYYKAAFKLKKRGDSFLDVSTWGKGFVWVNGHCLGRFWKVGPQQTLYCPAVWLKKGKNEIVVMDIIGPEEITMQGLASPIIDMLRKECLPEDAVKIEQQVLQNTSVQAESQGNDAAPGAK